MKTPDFQLLPLVETCLLIQSFFLNFLWILLFWGWIVASKKFPKQTLLGGRPGAFQWLVALFAWGLTLWVAVHEFDPIFWFLGFAIANGALLSVLNPAFALAFSLSMLLMRPWEIMAENELILEIPRFCMFFSIAWSLLYFFVLDRFSIRMQRVFALLLLYAAWVFLSTFITPNPDEARMGYNETIVRAVILFFLIFHLARDQFSVWAVKVSMVTIFTCVGLIAIVFYAEKYTDGGRIIAFGIFKNTNDIGAVMTMLLPLASTPLFRWQTTGKLEKMLSAIPISIALTVLALTQSRGAILALAISAIVFVFLKFRKKAIVYVVAVLILAGGQLATKVFNRAGGDLEGSSNSRRSFVISGMRMALFNPVFGVGFGQFPKNFESYATEISDEYGQRTAHSTWILALAEGGPIGLILFAAFYFWGSFKNGLRLFKDDPSWLFASASYGTSMTFLSHTYVIFPYILVAATTVACGASMLKKSKSGEVG